MSEKKESAQARRGVPLWLALGLSVLLVVIGLLVASVTCGPLYALVMPPAPPVYPGAQLLHHENSAHGIDTWLYRSDGDICEIYTYYRALAETCELDYAAVCDGPRLPPPNRYLLYIGACEGSGGAGTFNWSWHVNLREQYPHDGTPYAEFDITRTVYW